MERCGKTMEVKTQIWCFVLAFCLYFFHKKEKKESEQETKLFSALICNTSTRGNAMHSPISLFFNLHIGKKLCITIMVPIW